MMEHRETVRMVPFCLRSLLLLLACVVHVQAFVKLCYFPNWAHQRASPYARFDVDNIDPALCTHLVYAFASIDVASGRIVPRYQDEDVGPGGTRGRYQRFNDIKKNNTHIKTLISIGGEFAGSSHFIAVSRDDNSLQTFAQTTVDFLRNRNFDGLDVDWEYPDAATTAQFSRLLEALRTAFEDDPTQGQRLLLTVALPAGRHRIQDVYNMTVLNIYVDLASLMTYDYHGRWNSVTGFDSPLYSRLSNPQFNQELSTKWTVDYYISEGLAVDKILVGVTAAGTHFRLQDLNITGVGAPVIPTASSSPKWQLPDRYAYPEICEVLQAANSERVFDEEQQVPYVYQDHDWFGYEDVHSIEGKTEWMMTKGVAGMMFWALDMDDFRGTLCDQGPFPLLTAVSRRVDQLQNDTDTTAPGTAVTGTDGTTGTVTIADRTTDTTTTNTDTDTGGVARGSWGLCLAVMALRSFCG